MGSRVRVPSVPLIEFVRGNGLIGEILADFSIQNPIIDSQVIGLIVKEKRKQKRVKRAVTSGMISPTALQAEIV